MTAVIAITSGKTGAGRSLLGSNLAHYLNHQGYHTGLLVAGSQSPLWGAAPNATWPNIIGGRLPIAQAIEQDVFGVDLMIANGHGHAMVNLSTQTAGRLDDPTGILGSYAYLIIDMAAGISTASIACCLAATEAIMVVTPEAPSLIAAYEWLAKLVRHGFGGPVNIVVNQVGKPALAQSVFVRFRDLAQQRLEIKTNLWGTMAREAAAEASDILQQPLADILPHSKLKQDIQVIADRLLAEQPPENQTTTLDAFWRQFISHLEKLPVIPITPPSQASETAADRPEPPQEDDASAFSSSPSSNVQALDYSAAFMHLGDQLADILKELRAIHELLENNSQPGDPARPETHLANEKMEQIDFDDFISRFEEKEN